MTIADRLPKKFSGLLIHLLLLLSKSRSNKAWKEALLIMIEPCEANLNAEDSV